MRLFSTKLYILAFFFFFNSFIQAQAKDLIRFTELDSIKSMRLKSPKRAIRYARQVLTELDPQKMELETKILNILGEIYVELYLPSIALQYFIDAGQKSSSRKNPWNKINIGNVYFQQSQWLEAKERYLQALDIFQRQNLQQKNSIVGRSVALSNLGRIERNLKNYDDALVYFKEALDIKRGQAKYKAFQKSLLSETIDFPKVGQGVAYQHSLLAELYYSWNLYDMALEQLNAADSLIGYAMKDPILGKSNSIKSDLGKNHLLRMNIFANIDNYAGAYIESKAAMGLLKESPILMARHHDQKADIQIEQDSLYSALNYLDRALKICELNGLAVFELSLLEKKVEIMRLNNLERSALGVADILLTKKDLISSNRMKLLLESLNYKSELDINRRKLEEAKSRETIFFVIVGFAFILVGMTIISFRNKRRSTKQEAKILYQDKIIAQNELKNKEDELIKLSANIVSKNDLLNAIDKDLEYYISLLENKADKKVMEPLRKIIQSKVDDSADWEQFQNQFSSAYPEFVEKLSAKFSNLRTADIKLCCYLRMSMNTKEIAKVTGLSVRAIENKRYRLRKKLNLDTAVSLDSFIHSFNGAVE